MKKMLLVQTALLVNIAICLTASAAGALAPSGQRELLVKWKDGPESHAAVVGNTHIGSIVKRNFNALGWQLVQLPEGMSVRAGIEAYQALGTVSAVEPNGIIEPILPPVGPAVPSASGEGDDATAQDGAVRTPRPTIGLHAPTSGIIPNDPRFRDQWYLKKIGATNAWSTTSGSTNVVVAILDSGVDYTHPDLAANIWRNPGEIGVDDQGRDKETNGIDDDNNGYVDDVHGVNVIDGTGDPMDLGFYESPGRPATDPVYHGTLIAGIIGAVGNNGLGIAGLNWSVQIMAIRFIGGDRSRPEWITAFYSDNLAAFDYVFAMKRRGVNIRITTHSYGGHVESVAVRDALAALGNEGVLNVCAAGNMAFDQDLYGSLPGVMNVTSIINVAASTESDALADSSNYGRSTVDLAAPGVNIVSTWKGLDYGTGYGTSFACPLVAGAAALLLSGNPSLTVDELKSALFGSVDQSVSLRGKVVTNGRLNVSRALEYLTNANPPAIVISALPAGNRAAADAPIRVTFNRPMNRSTVESAFVLTPAVSGTFNWTDDSRSFSFHHDVPFNTATNYTVRLLATAQDDSGGTLDGDFDRIREALPADDFVWMFRFPIANDDFANAQLLAGASGSVTGNNRYAYDEVDEPRTFFEDWRIYGSSLWYRWTAPEAGGWFTFDLTSGTGFDSLLIIYAGDRIDRLMPVEGNDNYGTRTGSRVSFAASAGTSYAVVVAGKDEFDPCLACSFTLRWYATPPPSFSNSQFSTGSGAPGARITLMGSNLTGATSVLFNGASASFANAASTNLDLRITAVIPPDATSGPITVVTPHGSVTSTASFQVLPPPLTIRLTGANGLEITWPATSSAFMLEASDDLNSGFWVPIAETLHTVNGASILAVPAPIGSRFYRLRTR